MAKSDSNPGMAVDAGGNPVIDPTKNVLDLVEAAVRRLNDLHVQEVEFNEKLRQSDIKRADDLRDTTVTRINQALEDHKIFNKECNNHYLGFTKELSTEKELRLQQKFDSLDKAIEKANIATEKRFEGVNEFRNTLSDQQRTFIPRSEYEAGHKSLSDIVQSMEKNLAALILAQKERIDIIAAKKEGGATTWVLIVGAVAIATSIIDFVIGIAGK